MKNKKQRLIVISGPTAVGKSNFAVETAKKINGEIISADSMQIYKSLDIGTGKIKKNEMQGIGHYLIDIVNPDEDYSVGNFVTRAKDCIETIVKKNKMPIIAGGTGLYINALLNGFSLAQSPKNDEVRNILNERLINDGAEKLYLELQRIDKTSAGKIALNDTKRIIRALEIFYTSGKTKSESATKSAESEFDYYFVILNDDRQKLYERIEKRVDSMIENGLIDEVNSLIKYKDCNSMQAIGYKEIVQFLENKITKTQAIESIKTNSRRYAKRQLTYLRWLPAQKEWADINELKKTIKNIENYSSMSDITL